MVAAEIRVDSYFTRPSNRWKLVARVKTVLQLCQKGQTEASKAAIYGQTVPPMPKPAPVL